MATDLILWGLLLVIVVAAGCLVYFQRAKVKRARADAQRAEAELAAGSARLAALIERLQAGLSSTARPSLPEPASAGSAPAERVRQVVTPALRAVQAAETGPFVEEERRLAGLFVDQAAIAQENARLLEQAQQELAERGRVEEGLRYRTAFERLAVKLAARFIALPPAEVDDGINQGLADIGSFAGVDRGYVYLFTAAGATMDNTHEWCAEGVESQIADSQDVSSDSLPWWMARLRNSETIHIPLVSALPPEAGAEREILERRGVCSLVVAPMMLGGELVGFLGFDSMRETKTWSEEDVALLGILSEIIVNALERADTVWTTW